MDDIDPIESVLQDYLAMFRGALPPHVIDALTVIFRLDDDDTEVLDDALLQHAGTDVVEVSPPGGGTLMTAANLQPRESTFAPCIRFRLRFGTLLAATFECPLLLLHTSYCTPYFDCYTAAQDLGGSDLPVPVHPLQETYLLP